VSELGSVSENHSLRLEDQLRLGLLGIDESGLSLQPELAQPGIGEATRAALVSAPNGRAMVQRAQGEIATEPATVAQVLDLVGVEGESPSSFADLEHPVTAYLNGLAPSSRRPQLAALVIARTPAIPEAVELLEEQG
jgi:hypothetical protein